MQIRVSNSSFELCPARLHKPKHLNDFLCNGDEKQRSVEDSSEHTSSYQVAHRNGLHNGMKMFLFVQSAEALYQQWLLTPESYALKKAFDFFESL